MTWLAAYWLCSLPLIWGLLWLGLRYQQSKNDWQRWVEPELLKAMQGEVSGRHPFPAWYWLLTIILSLLIVAIAGPSWQQREQPLLAPASARILILDLSASMRATDIPPSRIEWSRAYLLSIISDDFEGETALIAFSGQAYVVSPLTRDSNTLKRFISALHPEQMPSDGNRLDQAIAQAADLLTTSPSGRGQIIVISDGTETLAASRNVAAGAYLDNLELTLIAVGTVEGAPLTGENGELLRDGQGQISLVKTDFEGLRRVAEAGGGRFMMNPSQPLVSVNTMINNRAIPASDSTDDKINVSAENGGFWLLWLVLPCLLLLFRRNALPVVLLGLMVTAHNEEASAADWSAWWLNQNQQAWQALQLQRPGEAIESATDPLLQGYARYQIADYRAVLELPGLDDTADGLYLRGNAMVQLGLMRQALEAFQQALSMRSDFSAASYNQALVDFYLQQQAAQAQSASQAADPVDNNAEILSQRSGQNAMAAGNVEGESDDSNDTGLGAGMVENPGSAANEEIDAAVIDAELQQFINSLRQQTQIPQQEQLRRWEETLNADLGELFQRKFLRDYQRATGDR